MDDVLSAFRDESETQRELGPRNEELELLLLAQGTLLLAVPAQRVDSVVPWTDPVPIPEASRHVLGVVQDRGRLVAVARPLDAEARPHRLVICSSPLGLVGVPATSTRSVGMVRLQGAHVLGQPVLTDSGALTVLDVDAMAENMVRES